MARWRPKNKDVGASRSIAAVFSAEPEVRVKNFGLELSAQSSMRWMPDGDGQTQDAAMACGDCLRQYPPNTARVWMQYDAADTTARMAVYTGDTDSKAPIPTTASGCETCGFANKYETASRVRPYGGWWLSKDMRPVSFPRQRNRPNYSAWGHAGRRIVRIATSVGGRSWLTVRVSP